MGENNNNNNNNNEASQQQHRPSDADIIAWENRIREEEVRDVALVGGVESLDVLEQEYRSGSEIFLAKIAALRQGYSAIRRTRGDGNCFFRSFIFAYVEDLLRQGTITTSTAERDEALAHLDTIRQRLLDAGYEELVLETPLELLLGMLRSIGSPTEPLTLEALESNMRSEDVSNYIVMLLRLITSAEVKRRASFFAPFIMGLSDMDVESFCRSCIDPMGEESDHVHMVALTDALQVPVRVVYLDRSMATSPFDTAEGGGGGGAGVGGGASESYHPQYTLQHHSHHHHHHHDAVPGASLASAAPGGAASTAGTVISGAAAGHGTRGAGVTAAPVKVDVHDFIPEGLPASGSEPRVHLLYRPGHYDILYVANN